MGSLTTLSFITPLALLLSALAIPVILLYMLRLRRTEMPISSTFLWQQLVRDREANAPWQKLRPNLLLLLQLLILLALVIGLARPFTEFQTITTGRIVLLLDASASMQATDVAPNRFAAARDVGLELVDALGADDTMTVIQVSAVPEVLVAGSRDKVVLRDAIRAARPGEVSADWVSAMTLAAAGAKGVDELKVVIVSDGGLPPDLPDVPGDVRFVPVGDDASNVAVSALATAAIPGMTPQLFIRLSNYGTVDTDVILDGRLNGSDTVAWARRYTVPAQGHVDIFDIELPDSFESLRTELTMPVNAAMPDHLPADNVAYTVRDRSGIGRVLLVTDDNVFLRNVFRSLRGVDLLQSTPDNYLPQDDVDLVVFDGWLPDELPAGDLLIVDPPRRTAFFGLGETVGLGPNGRLSIPLEAEGDPRVQHLGYYIETVGLLLELRELTEIDWATTLVAMNDTYPVVVTGEIGSQQIAIMPFDVGLSNTDLVLQPAWPILVAELVSWFSPPPVTGTLESLLPGSPVTIRFIDGADAVVITRPNGDRVTLSPRGSSAVFAGTTTPGLYTVELRRDGRTQRTERFAVNLFDQQESDITPQSSVMVGQQEVKQDAREETARREWWPWLAGIGLAILAVEWWVYHRSLQRMPRVTLAGLRQTRQRETNRLRAWVQRWRRRHRSYRPR